MTSRHRRSLLTLVCSLVVLPSAYARPTAAPEQAALAERYAQVAEAVTVSEQAGAGPLRMAAALFDASIRLNPSEKRVIRGAVDLALRMGERDKAIDLLAVYRRLDPDDQLAQVQAIDLFVDRMQTADGRSEYLQKIVAANGVPAPVRSHAATIAAGVLRERGQTAAADEMLAEALKLNPQNPKALQTRYEDTLKSGTPVDRVKALAALLNSNPAQPAVMSTLGEELMSAGAFDDAQQWYGRSISVSQQTGNVPSSFDLLNYAAALLQTGETKGASSAAAAVLKSEPTAAAAFQIKLLADKNDAEEYPKTLLAARQAVTSRLNLAAALIDLPSDARLPEIAPDAPLIDVRAAAVKIKARDRKDLAPSFSAALADLIWLDVYFEGKPAPGEAFEALETLIGAEHQVLTRLRGWNALVGNNAADAKVKLSAVAARDPLARLGEILLTAKDTPDAAKTDLSTLAAQHPLGTTGALLRASAGMRKAPVAGRPDAAELHAAVTAVPAKWLEVLTNARNFYALKADPLRVAHAYGQPMLVEITVTNISDFPLTIGPGGIIGAGVTIDASIKGVVTQYVPAVATARLTGKLVLSRNESVSTIVRIDTGRFQDFMAATPQPSITVFVSALTNPLATNNSIVAGPGGYRAQATRVVERSAMPLASPEARKAFLERIASQPGDVRLRNYDMITTIVRNLRSSKGEPAPDTQAVIDGFMGVVDAARKSDPAPEVRAFAGYLAATLYAGDDLTARVKDMIAAPDRDMRTFGILAALTLDRKDRLATLQPIVAGDADDVVKRLAAGAILLPDPPATRPAATRPATDAPAAGDETQNK